MALLSILDRNHTIAGPGFSRWMVPPAALCVHLCIGQAYAFSVFNLPMSRLIGITQSAADDWKLTDLGWIFSIAIVVLGLSAAMFGRWVEEGGPRRAMFTAGLCFSSGFIVSAIGVYVHNIWIVYLGYGVIGGIGLGLGYISPVSTLIKWFPDRPGMATGMAIMGFGGGAFIASPLGTKLMVFYHASSHPIAATWVTMGLLYFVFMMFGVFTIRVPAEGWKPEGWVPKAKQSALISTHKVDVNAATRSPQFWLLWLILCMNVTAGIGILEQASPMIQDLFRGRVSPVAAAGFVGLLSLFNMGGRFVWASMSDFIGRKTTYFVFFVVGVLLYVALPFTEISHLNSVSLFVLIAGVLISMYGGGFATIPAYLKDLFGGYHVSAIHGRLLTAWSTAGIVGPLIVNGILNHYVANPLPKQQAYPVILHIMAGLMVGGFIANLLVRPVAKKYWLETAGTQVGAAR